MKTRAKPSVAELENILSEDVPVVRGDLDEILNKPEREDIVVNRDGSVTRLDVIIRMNRLKQRR